jgi:3-oxoadipate enol-lactonase
MKSFWFKSSRGYNLHYQVVENILPSTTVFLHGNIASNRWWIPTKDVFYKNSIGKNFNGDMICIELLGCGRSEAPSKPEDMDLIGFASDFNELLAYYKSNSKKLIDKFNLVGHSTGGFIAAAMTGLDSKLFNKSVLLNPPGANGLVLTGAIKAAYDAMKANKSILSAAIGSTIFKNDYQSAFFQDVILTDAHSAIQKISHWIVQAFHRIDAHELMKESTTPTLVLFGQEDRMLNADDAKYLATQDLKNASFEFVPNHGHSMNIENPESFVKKISSFLFS